jgi:hypothetical protein
MLSFIQTGLLETIDSSSKALSSEQGWILACVAGNNLPPPQMPLRISTMER